jgi:hypothetical protein
MRVKLIYHPYGIGLFNVRQRATLQLGLTGTTARVTSHDVVRPVTQLRHSCKCHVGQGMVYMNEHTVQ